MGSTLRLIPGLIQALTTNWVSLERLVSSLGAIIILLGKEIN